jgi:hypothetical protein|tara:strand:- start:65 stop:496 length:432 start_codon:yes stop_codon:yes gene_type:complete
MITEDAKKKVALFLKEFYTQANVGVGGGSTNPSATALDVPLLSSMIVTENTASDEATIDFKATLSGASVTGQTLREFGIFGELPQDDQFDEMRLEGVQISGTAATDGTEATVETIMLGRVNFDGVSSLSASDEIEFVYTVEVE